MSASPVSSVKKENLLWAIALFVFFCIGAIHGYVRKNQLAKTRPTISWAVTGYVMPLPLEEYLENLYGIKIEFHEIKSFQDFRTKFTTSDLVIAPLHWIETLQKEKLLRKLDPIILENAALAPEFTPLTIGETALPLFWELFKSTTQATAKLTKSESLPNSDLIWTWLNFQNQRVGLKSPTEVDSWRTQIKTISQASFEKITNAESFGDNSKANPLLLWTTAVTIPSHSIYRSLGQKLLFEITRRDVLLGWTEAYKVGTAFENLKHSTISSFYQPETLREISLIRLQSVQKMPSSAESAMLEAFRTSP